MNRPGLCVVGGLILLASVSARARADEWRDGCPAGYRPHYQRDPRLGAAAETESALTEGRLVAGVDPSYYTSRTDLPRSATYRGFAHLQARVWRGLTVGLTGSYLRHLETGERAWWPGSVVGSIGWRYDFEGELPPDAVVNTEGSGVRRAVMVQLLGGGGPSGIPLLAAYRREAALHPFDGYLLASNVVGIAAELRFEQVGCQAVFAHLRASVLVTGLGDAASGGAPTTLVEEPSVTAPATLALGAYVADHGALIAEYGLAVQHPSQTLGYVATHRFRAVFDYAADWGNVGFHIDFASRIEGIVGGGYVAINGHWLEDKLCGH